jgi:hypothetical protein
MVLAVMPEGPPTDLHHRAQGFSAGALVIRAKRQKVQARK